MLSRTGPQAETTDSSLMTLNLIVDRLARGRRLEAVKHTGTRIRLPFRRSSFVGQHTPFRASPAALGALGAQDHAISAFSLPRSGHGDLLEPMPSILGSI